MTVDEGLEHYEKNVYTVYDDPRRTEWIVKIQPALKNANLQILVRLCKNKLSRREIIELRAGRKKKPHRKTQELLVGILHNLGLV
jgi:flagellar motor switch protein FliM